MTSSNSAPYCEGAGRRREWRLGGMVANRAAAARRWTARSADAPGRRGSAWRRGEGRGERRDRAGILSPALFLLAGAPVSSRSVQQALADLAQAFEDARLGQQDHIDGHAQFFGHQGGPGLVEHDAAERPHVALAELVG